MTKPRPPRLARSLAELEGLRDGPPCVAYVPDSRDGRRAIVSAAAAHGGDLFGRPGDVRGARVPGLGSVSVISALGDGIIEDEAQLAEVRRELGAHGRTPRTGGAAAVAWLATLEPGIAKWTHRVEAFGEVLEAAVHAGPVEVRDAMIGVPGVYLDQRAAHLRAIRGGLPRGDWLDERPTNDALWRALHDPARCVVAEATAYTPEARLPVRGLLATTHPTGEVRTVATDAHWRRALLEPGAELLKVHRLLTATRDPWSRFIGAVDRALERGGAAKIAAKAVYQRVWGKLLAGDGLTGEVVEAIDPPEPTVRGVFHSVEAGERGDHTVRWTRGRYQPAWYRPDVAAAIVGEVSAETLDLAARGQRARVRVGMLHVDAVLGGPELRGLADPERWGVKGEGETHVFGPGRYACGLARGRMGG